MIKRLFLCVIVLALLSVAATGEVMTESPATSVLFGESDLVCKCTVTSLSVMDRQTVTERGGRFVRETWRAVLQVEDLYKGTAASPIGLEYSLDIDGMSFSLSVKTGETYLLFLKTAGNGTYTLFFDQWFAARPFASLPVQGGKPGVAKLESALVAAALQQNPDETLKAFSYLEGLEDIHPESLVALSAVLTSPNWKLVWSYLTLQLKTKTPESVAAVRRFVDSYTGTEEPRFVGLQVVKDPRAHDDLVTLSYSRFGNIRAAAMVALRSMGGQKDAAFFIRRLDDPDRNVQYHAVFGLAQAFQMSGDYGPGIGAFERNPDYYTNLWKEWWKKREVTTQDAK